jgi:hypothetical protein
MLKVIPYIKKLEQNKLIKNVIINFCVFKLLKKIINAKKFYNYH